MQNLLKIQVDNQISLYFSDSKVQKIWHPTLEKLITEYSQKMQHKQHPWVKDQFNMVRKSSNLCQKVGEHFSKMKGFTVVIKHKVNVTINHQNHILQNNADDKYRLCVTPHESIEYNYIIDGCGMLVQREYTHGNNYVARIVYQEIASYLGHSTHREFSHGTGCSPENSFVKHLLLSHF